jgi:hypothetical protein
MEAIMPVVVAEAALAVLVETLLLAQEVQRVLALRHPFLVLQ